MISLLAHFTTSETPAGVLLLLAGFVGGVLVASLVGRFRAN